MRAVDLQGRYLETRSPKDRSRFEPGYRSMIMSDSLPHLVQVKCLCS
jgi:hypothetical protein